MMLRLRVGTGLLLIFFSFATGAGLKDAEKRPDTSGVKSIGNTIRCVYGANGCPIACEDTAADQVGNRLCVCDRKGFRAHSHVVLASGECFNLGICRVERRGRDRGMYFNDCSGGQYQGTAYSGREMGLSRIWVNGQPLTSARSRPRLTPIGPSSNKNTLPLSAPKTTLPGLSTSPAH